MTIEKIENPQKEVHSFEANPSTIELLQVAANALNLPIGTAARDLAILYLEGRQFVTSKLAADLILEVKVLRAEIQQTNKLVGELLDGAVVAKDFHVG